MTSLVVDVCGNGEGLLFESLFLEEMCNSSSLVVGDGRQHLRGEISLTKSSLSTVYST